MWKSVECAKEQREESGEMGGRGYFAVGDSEREV